MSDELQPSEARLRHAIAERLATGRETVAELAKDYGMTSREIIAAVAWAWQDHDIALDRIADLLERHTPDGGSIEEAVARVTAQLEGLLRMDDAARLAAEQDAAAWRRRYTRLASAEQENEPLL